MRKDNIILVVPKYSQYSKRAMRLSQFLPAYAAQGESKAVSGVERGVAAPTRIAPPNPRQRVTSSTKSPHVYHLINMMCHFHRLCLLSRQKNHTCKITCKNSALAVLGRTEAVSDGL